jgi:predicted lipid-binding transport protein (Tim44 family)
MEDPTTIALNLTFFGTLGVAFFMFLGLFLVFAATLVIAGIGRLAAVVVMAVARIPGRDQQPRDQGADRPAAKPAGTVKPGRAARPGAKPRAKKEPALSPEWAAAVVRADARATARAKAEAGPAVRVSVRDLPSPKAPARDITKVSALVESATDSNGTLGVVPRAFKKPPMPVPKSLLDTGSLVSLRGILQAGKAKPQAQERKAG